MKKSTYIRLVKGSTQQEITLGQVKDLLNMFIERTTKTGEQLGWSEYNEVAFPYTIEEKDEEGLKYLFLKAKHHLYNYLTVGVDTEEVDGETRHYIQIVIPDEDHVTSGDQNKANVLAKYLSKYLKAELHLFNGRIIYNNPRK